MKILTKTTTINEDIRNVDYKCFGLTYLNKQWCFDGRKTHIFGIKISQHKYIKAPRSGLNLITLMTKKFERVPSKKIDIIIPVYNGYQYLDALFDSIYKNTDLEYQITVIDDASPDPRILPTLGKWQKQFAGNMRILQNKQNLGFVKTVNRGLQCTDNDVVLLNTDCVVPQNWASRLMYPLFSDGTVASVTPFTNSGTIFSVPRIFRDNVLYGDLAEINKAIGRINAPFRQLTFPTGVGFCMAMSRVAINKIGGLDEIFERGYGEENDWCMRAIKNGFINTIAANLVVWHKHGGSFQNQDKSALIQRHMKIIHSRYPEYANMVDKSVKNNDFLAVRFLVVLLMLNKDAKSTQCWFDHSYGGGTETYTKNQFARLSDDTLCIRFQEGDYNYSTISICYKDVSEQLNIKTDQALWLLGQIKPDEIIVNNLADYKNPLGFLDIIKKLKQDTHAFVSFRGHDLQCVCPTINMLNYANCYCNCPCADECRACWNRTQSISAIKTESIGQWQKQWHNFLKNTADEIIVFSESTANIFIKKYPDIKHKIKIIPHTISGLRMVNIPPHNGINIAVQGTINVSKGAKIVQEMDTLIKDMPGINLYVIGNITEKLKNTKVLGKYTPEQLPDIIEKNNIDVIFIPSIWPETFSYTTSEAISMNIPVACFDIGAPAARVKKYRHGIVISKIDAKTALDEIAGRLLR